MGAALLRKMTWPVQTEIIDLPSMPRQAQGHSQCPSVVAMLNSWG